VRDAKAEKRLNAGTSLRLKVAFEGGYGWYVGASEDRWKGSCDSLRSLRPEILIGFLSNHNSPPSLFFVSISL